jgi:peptidoglycan/LPS O-acetylase OafA/YrhL
MIEKTSPKFEFLDGLRGLSALYVVFYHGQLFSGHTREYLTSSFFPITTFLSFGHFSISIFIVLSGFCLTIPLAASTERQLKGGFKRYITRRFTRIVPPYYIALGIFLLLILSVPLLQTAQNTAWDSKIPVTLQSIIAHIFLIHNFSYEWLYKIDGPMWSVATEWQIYFLFPILIWAWNKFGLTASFILAMAIGFIVSRKLAIMHPWYLGLFAMGMVASIICFSKESVFTKLNQYFNWRLISKVASIAMVITIPLFSYKHVSIFLLESYMGLLVSLILINFTLIEINSHKKPIMLKILNSKAAGFLGLISYSIYLIHSPILGLFNLIALQYDININLRLLMMFFIFIPITLIICYIFHIAVERRFIPSRGSKPGKDQLDPVKIITA